MKLSIGIDWADQSHAICIREVETRRIRAEFEIDHDGAGVEKLEQIVSALEAEASDCMVAIESAQGMLVNYLLKAGYQVYAIPPETVIDYRGRRRRSGAKSDQDDALLLADILCMDRELYRPIAADSPLVKEIQAISRTRQQWVKRRTQIINQLKQSLKAYFPLAVDLFSALDTQIAQAFLTHYPDYQAIQQASDQELVGFFQAQGYTRPDLVPNKIARLRTACIPVPDWQVRTGRFQTEGLLEQLKLVAAQIKTAENCLAELLARHPDTLIFNSLPGAGPILTAALLGEIGDCRDKYASACEIQALAGTAPVTRRSSAYVQHRFRYSCHHFLRDTLQEFARASTRPGQSVWARAYFNTQLELGHSASRAYRALANRWLVIIFRMWQDRSLYDEDYHLRNIARRGVKPLPHTLAQVA